MGQWEHYEEGWEREREVGDLGCLMTPCLSKDICVMYDHTVENTWCKRGGIEREREREGGGGWIWVVQ